MGIFSLFKTPKAKSFSYQPRYYNAEREALQARIERLTNKAENTSDELGRQARIREAFRNRSTTNQKKKFGVQGNQIVIMLWMGLSAYAYLSFTETAFYIFFFGGLAYLLLKVLSQLRKK